MNRNNNLIIKNFNIKQYFSKIRIKKQYLNSKLKKEVLFCQIWDQWEEVELEEEPEEE
jgi:hypothetical protein